MRNGIKVLNIILPLKLIQLTFMNLFHIRPANTKRYGITLKGRNGSTRTVKKTTPLLTLCHTNNQSRMIKRDTNYKQKNFELTIKTIEQTDY